MAVRHTKPAKASPTFERINLDRIKRCEETAGSAQRAIEKSKKLTEQARELIDAIRKRKEDKAS